MFCMDGFLFLFQGKSRARMSHEMLRAVATVQEQAKYLAFPDPSVKTSQSPLPLPVYVPETPALLIVHSQRDTFVDPEGSVIVGATVHAKLHGNSDVVEVRKETLIHSLSLLPPYFSRVHRQSRMYLCGCSR